MEGASATLRALFISEAPAEAQPRDGGGGGRGGGRGSLELLYGRERAQVDQGELVCSGAQRGPVRETQSQPQPQPRVVRSPGAMSAGENGGMRKFDWNIFAVRRSEPFTHSEMAH